MSRKLEYLYSLEKIEHLLKKHLVGKSLFLRSESPPPELKVTGLQGSNVLTLKSKTQTLEPKSEVMLFRILGRYIELKGKVVAQIDRGVYDVLVESVGIASTDREALRIPVREEDGHITNIRASRHTIDTSANAPLPTSVKVGFAEYEQLTKKRFDTVHIAAFLKRGTVEDEIRKTRKSLLLKNAQDPESYKAPSPEYIDYAKFLEGKVQKEVFKYKNQKIVSEVIVPVIYRTHDLEEIPIGYFQVQSKSKQFDESTVEELTDLSQKMVEKIKDSNTVFMKEKQRIINVSKGGLRVLITHPELKSYLERQNGFTFDVVFKMQSPVTIHAGIRSATRNPANELILGLEIEGNASGKESIERYEDNVATLETRVRAEIAAKKERQKYKR